MGGGNGEGGGNGDGGGEGTRDIITCYSLSEASKVVLSRTNFEDFSKDCPKEDFKRFQLCGKERDKKEDTKRHSTRRKEHTDTVYA